MTDAKKIKLITKYVKEKKALFNHGKTERCKAVREVLSNIDFFLKGKYIE